MKLDFIIKSVLFIVFLLILFTILAHINGNWTKILVLVVLSFVYSFAEAMIIKQINKITGKK
jgi:hypothetical protein